MNTSRYPHTSDNSADCHLPDGSPRSQTCPAPAAASRCYLWAAFCSSDLFHYLLQPQLCRCQLAPPPRSRGQTSAGCFITEVRALCCRLILSAGRVFGVCFGEDISCRCSVGAGCYCTSRRKPDTCCTTFIISVMLWGCLCLRLRQLMNPRWPSTWVVWRIQISTRPRPHHDTANVRTPNITTISASLYALFVLTWPLLTWKEQLWLNMNQYLISILSIFKRTIVCQYIYWFTISYKSTYWLLLLLLLNDKANI